MTSDVKYRDIYPGEANVVDRKTGEKVGRLLQDHNGAWEAIRADGTTIGWFGFRDWAKAAVAAQRDGRDGADPQTGAST